MRKHAIICSVAIAAGVAAGAASADALRCGANVISRGDHAAEVLHHCGEPDSVYSWVARRGVIAARSIFLPGFVEEVLVEEWTYNLGPHKLMRQIRLENGIVRDVKHLGYGYRER
ncbi:MAG TPA: DUF2845 domain-containing protein [Gammaproteobacteria bacterium]